MLFMLWLDFGQEQYEAGLDESKKLERQQRQGHNVNIILKLCIQNVITIALICVPQMAGLSDTRRKTQ